VQFVCVVCVYVYVCVVCLCVYICLSVCVYLSFFMLHSFDLFVLARNETLV
jgi:hypothetical protein